MPLSEAQIENMQTARLKGKTREVLGVGKYRIRRDRFCYHLIDGKEPRYFGNLESCFEEIWRDRVGDQSYLDMTHLLAEMKDITIRLRNEVESALSNGISKGPRLDLAESGSEVVESENEAHSQ